MKRSKPLQRRKPLAQGKGGLSRSALQRGTEKARERLQARLSEPGRDIWKAKRYGRCMVCGKWGRILRHHVVLEQMVRLVPGADPWDLCNSMDVGAHYVCSCHELHHKGRYKGEDTRILFAKVPPSAVRFACEVLGPGPAAIYFHRRYRDAPDPLDELKEAGCQ